MSISKLLMTAAVCTISMTAVSMSYGASDDTLDHSSRWRETPSRTMIESDNMSTMSGMSVIEQTRLDTFLKTLWTVFKRSQLPLPQIGKQATKLMRVEVYADAIVSSHNGLKMIAIKAKNELCAIAESLPLTEDEKTRLAKSDTPQGEIILKKIAEQTQALEEGRKELMKVESSRTIWKVGAIISSGVLVAVASVLINILKSHGLEIVLGSNR